MSAPPPWGTPAPKAPSAQQPTTPPSEPVKSQGRSWFVGGFITIILMVAVLRSLAQDSTTPKERAQAAADRVEAPTRKVEIHLMGTTRSADVTLRVGDHQEQFSPDIPLKSKNTGQPMALTYTLLPGTFVYVSAQMKSEFGTIRCQIDVDGVTVRTGSSSVSFGIATCSGRL